MTARPAGAAVDWLRATFPTASLLDHELLSQFAATRDDGPFAELVRRHGPMVLAVCRRVTRNEQDSEDAFQAAFLVLARRAGALAGRCALPAWLHRVAYHKALKARAASARRRARETAIDDLPDPDPPLDPLRREARAALDFEIAHLPEPLRAAVILCELEGRPRRHAAAALGIPEGTLSSRLAAARSRLAHALTRRGLAPVGVALTAAWARGAPALPPGLAARTALAAAALPAAGLGLVALVTSVSALLLLAAVGAFAFSPAAAPPAPPNRPTASADKAPEPPPKAEPLLRRAEEAADEIKDLHERATVLAGVAAAYHQSGQKAAADHALKRALDAARQVKEAPSRLAALRAVAGVEALRGDRKAALLIANSNDDKMGQNSLIHFATADLARHGHFAAALEAADSLTGGHKATALIEVATYQAQAGKTAAALKSLASVPDGPPKARALSEVARAQARAGDRVKSAASLAQARKLWEGVIDPRSRPAYLADHALAQAECGDVPAALKTFADARGLTDNWNLFWRIAVALDRAGDTRAALKFANGVKNVNGRHMVLARLAHAQALDGRKAAAKESLARARALHAALTDRLTKQFLHAPEAEVEMLLGDAKGALATARRADAGRPRFDALLAVGQAQARADRTGAIKTLAEAAGQLAGQESEPWWPTLYSRVMTDLAAAGGHKEALARINREKSARARAMGLLAVAEGLALARRGRSSP